MRDNHDIHTEPKGTILADYGWIVLRKMEKLSAVLCLI